MQLARQVIEIRDAISEKYSDCGSGVDRWKLESLNDAVKKDYGVATNTASTIGFNTIYGKDGD